jgi:hypothetical protein
MVNDGIVLLTALTCCCCCCCCCCRIYVLDAIDSSVDIVNDGIVPLTSDDMLLLLLLLLLLLQELRARCHWKQRAERWLRSQTLCFFFS